MVEIWGGSRGLEVSEGEPDVVVVEDDMVPDVGKALKFVQCPRMGGVTNIAFHKKHSFE
jgi:hypothetical protein